MISESFTAASQAAQESLGLLIVIENRVAKGDQDEAKKLLKVFQTYFTLHHDVIHTAQLELAAVAEGQVCWHSPSKGTSYFGSVHESVASLWLLLDVLSTRSDFVVPPDFIEWLGVNTSQLSAGLVRERAKLLGKVVHPPDEAGGPTEQDMAQLAEAIGDDVAAKVLTIANRTDLSVNDKLKLVGKLDERFKGKSSPELERLLKVSNVRGTDTWKEWRTEDKR